MISSKPVKAPVTSTNDAAVGRHEPPTAEITAELLALPLPGASMTATKWSWPRDQGSPAAGGRWLLAGVAALRARAPGKRQIATVASIAPHLGLAVPEALVLAAAGITRGAASAL